MDRRLSASDAAIQQTLSGLCRRRKGVQGKVFSLAECEENPGQEGYRGLLYIQLTSDR